MGRPRSFDVVAVLDKAAQVFRAKGFEGTSVEDLEKATGLRRASLYGAYGDKRAIYLACLKRYEGVRSLSFGATLCAGKGGRAAIECLFQGVIDDAVDDPCGCLVANAAIDQAGCDPRVARCLKDYRRRVESDLAVALIRGRRGGGDARVRARYLFVVMMGVRVLARTGCGRSELQGAVSEALRVLD